MTINDYYQHRDKVSSYKEPFFEFTYQDAISYLSYIFCISGSNTNPYFTCQSNSEDEYNGQQFPTALDTSAIQ